MLTPSDTSKATLSTPISTNTTELDSDVRNQREAPPTSTVPSVEAAITVEWFQLCAELVQVQVHVHQPPAPVLVEISSNLVKSFAAGLRNPEECEDEEEEEQCCEDQEHVWPTKVLRMETIQLDSIQFNQVTVPQVLFVRGVFRM